MKKIPLVLLAILILSACNPNGAGRANEKDTATEKNSRPEADSALDDTIQRLPANN